jgi:hypothetical protein
VGFSRFPCKSTRFFQAKSVVSEAVSNALWLLRSADAENTPSEITISSLCVLLESLTGLIFDEYKFEVVGEVDSFTAAKQDVATFLQEHPRRSEPGYLRLRNLVGSASLLRPEDKYRFVCNHFGLKWEGLMKEAWDAWKGVRHKMVHAALSNADRSPLNHFTTVGRIAGAINALALRLMGYSGIVRFSVYEDKHRTI